MAVGGPALLGIASNFINGMTNSFFNRVGMQDQAEINREQAEWQWKHFSSPEAQVRALSDVGMSPATVFGAGGSGQFAAPQTGDVSHAPIMSGGIDINNALNLEAQRQLAESQAKKNDAEAETSRLNNITVLQENLAKIDEMLSKKDVNDAQKELLLKQREEVIVNLETLGEKNVAEIGRTKSEQALNESRSRLVDAQIAFQQVLNEFAPAQQRAILEQYHAHSSELLAAAREHDASALEKAADEALKRFDKETQEKLRPHLIDKANAEADYEAYRAGNEGKRYMGGRVGYELPVGNADDKWSPDLPSYNPRRNYKYRK